MTENLIHSEMQFKNLFGIELPMVKIDGIKYNERDCIFHCGLF